MKTLIKILCLSVLWFSCERCDEPNGIYDTNEQYDDTNLNGQYDIGEFFEDKEQCYRYGWGTGGSGCDVWDECGNCAGSGPCYCGHDYTSCSCCDCDDIDNDQICDFIDCVYGSDIDEDGICDNVDDCVGEYDCAGVCNGGLVVDDCGICNGNNDSMDFCGNCQGENIEWIVLWGDCYNIEESTSLVIN